MFSSKKKRPPTLDLAHQNLFLNSSVHSLETGLSLNFTPCDSPELSAYLATLSSDKLEEILTYNKNPIKKSQNSVVNAVSLFFPLERKTQKLVKKQGGSSVQREIMITTAIRTNTDSNFPYHLFSLPIHQQSGGITNIFFTNYRKLGDLKTNISYIRQKIQLKDNSVLNYLFHIFHQLIIALEALHSSEFKDEEGKLHQGIIHNDIKPDNIFIKENGNIELADFGCSYFKDSIAPQFGTFWFSAPELWTNIDAYNEPVQNIEKSDIWSLGATLIYILNNELQTPLEKPHSEFEKMQYYKEWAKNYEQQWVKHVVKLGFTFNKNLHLMINELQEKIKLISLGGPDTSQKKILLETLAFLMLGPINVRPNIEKLNNIMNTLQFIFNEEHKSFVLQLLQNSKPKNDVAFQVRI